MGRDVEVGLEKGVVAVEVIAVVAEPHGSVLAALGKLEIHGHPGLCVVASPGGLGTRDMKRSAGSLAIGVFVSPVSRRRKNRR
jgi:hypothetical protein